MWVVPEHRGAGVGKALVEKVLSIAESRGESEVSLFVSPLNQAACALYEKAGFRFAEQVEALESHPEILVQRMSVDISSTHRQV
jgi:ribosomal protein S18 acetylase RimI-like enzyme